MLRSILILLLLAACGCTTSQPKLSLAHEIRVPKQWQGGANCPPIWSDSDISRYVTSYDRGWWWCIVQHAGDVDFQPKCSDFSFNGWESETEGWSAGVSDAQVRIEGLIRAYGKQKISISLADFKGLKLDDE
jgi:hypothetical protein